MPSPSSPSPDSTREAIIRSLTPYEVTARITLGLSAPATIAIPLVRRLLGRSGVQVGPSLLSVVNALVNIALLRAARQQGLSQNKFDAMPLNQRRLAVALVAWAVVGPALAALPDQTIILRRRSPLWAYLVDMTPRLALALGLVGAARRQLRRTAA